MPGVRVLVVDGEVSIRKRLRVNLEEEGYRVTTAVTGAEALKMLEAERPGLVILGSHLDGTDGLQVCRRIRQQSSTPIIMVASPGSADDKAKCLDFGADDCITRPFGAGELVARVRAVMRRVSPPSQ